VAQLLDRLDDRVALLAGGDRLAAGRHRSLAATVEWSYQLLGDDERRVFRRLSVFPGPFTLEAAEAVAGAGAGPAVLHLVDCSLLSPPQAGPDGRSRYQMLETLRAYGSGLLAGAGELEEAAAVLARYGVQVVELAAAGLQTSGAEEVAAARRLGAGPRPGYRCPAGSRAGLVVAGARPAPGPVRAAARDRRTRRGRQRRLVRRSPVGHDGRTLAEPGVTTGIGHLPSEAGLLMLVCC